MTSPNSKPQVLVGVVPGTAAAVVDVAGGLADRLGADLVCATVDASSEEVKQRADGTVVSEPINPDLPFEETQVFDPGLRAEIAGALDSHPVTWSVRALAGGPVQELARLADQLDAAMIVVGTRESGFRGSIEEFFTTSVMVQLAHHQHRPVVAVPLHPVLDDGLLPWQSPGD
ncbi:universal stress protein [Arthrobacter sunyaminii]|uniref:Universal stress protein n=1 Tax=Arthrobacter sunyaminii TaxID=2816859 RepID=A0A975PCV4_9MICC|nr:universal stress protein [Arthrobacter sunyaminii]MBO0897662.1 universal stress protein [Arthrobacter sunyaminii]MBO0909207.1 universal stress protein [Arthrobacter sunyaminii]QWQ35315.1 universal stress protein [Arthrobacter sunyaminii]